MRFLPFAAVSAAVSMFAVNAFGQDAIQPANPAAAQAAPPSAAVPAQTAAAPASDPNKLICHQVVYDGMLVHRPQCMTASQWEARRATRQRELQQLQIRATIHGG